jgi:hypothetical protein
MNATLKRIILIVVTTATPAEFAAAQTLIYVDHTATGPQQDGSEWTSAFTDLQDALALAREAFSNAPGSPIEIRVADGAYRPAATNGDRAATFELSDGVRLLGGFAGAGAANPDERNFELFETILSGDLNANDGPAFSGYDENAFHVVTLTGQAESTLVDGFTISGGSADGSPPFDRGAGVYSEAAAPTITHCRIQANTAHRGGGGLYNLGGDPVITDCEFSDNRSVSLSGISGGAGFHNNGGNPIFSHCLFAANHTPSSGGGLKAQSGNPTFTHCRFEANSAGFGGGLFTVESPILKDCEFVGNSATLGGGMAAPFGNPTLTRCHFEGNSATKLGGGFGTDNNVNPHLVDCRFIGNHSETDAGAMNLLAGSPRVFNCVFFENSASRFGGALQIDAEDLVMSNCVFGGNSALFGGAIQTFIGGSQLITHCTIAHNTASEFAGGVFAIGSVGEPLRFNNGVLYHNADRGVLTESAQLGLKGAAPVNITYTIVEGLDTLAGIGNIDADPRFVDAHGADGVTGTADDNYRLAADAPGINAGDPEFRPTGALTDLDGHARVLCKRVDIGAYEFGIGDVNCDRVVDLSDIAKRRGCVTGPEGRFFEEICAAFDFDGDRDVDFHDFAGLQRAFSVPVR